MVTIHVLNIDGKATLPVRGDGKSESRAAGYDVVAVDEPKIVGVIGREIELSDGVKIPLYKSIDYLEYHTALKISPLPNSYGDYHHVDLHPRSSVRKYNLVLANSVGLIDNDYRGEILVSFKYLFQPEDFVIEFEEIMNADGTAVAYIKPKGMLGGINLTKIYRKGDKVGQLVAEKTNPINFTFVSELDATVRGEGGHGSTDTPKAGATNAFGSSIVERYQQAGGIPTRKKYSDEMKERDRE